MKLSNLPLRQRLRLTGAALIGMMVIMALVVWLRSKTLEKESDQFAVFGDVYVEVSTLQNTAQSYIYLKKHVEAQAKEITAATARLRDVSNQMVVKHQHSDLAQTANSLHEKIDELIRAVNEWEEERMAYAERNEALIAPQHAMILKAPRIQNEKTRALVESGHLNIYTYYFGGTMEYNYLQEGISDYRAAEENIKLTGDDTFMLGPLQDNNTRLVDLQKSLDALQRCKEGTAHLFTEITNELRTFTARRMNLLTRGNTLNGIIMLCMDLAIMLFTLFTLEHLGRSWGRGVSEVSQMLNGMFNGDLSSTHHIAFRFQQREDELGHLARATSGLSGKLREVVQEVSRHSEMLNATASQMSALAVTLSEGAHTQASGAEEASSALEEMTAGIDMNSESSIASGEKAKEGLQSMQQIQRVVEETVKSTEAVGTKIGVIAEIANQTNILALNAAVEAARAGENGRGFAVVASEVRKLAERSNESAQEIVELVGQLVQTTRAAGADFNVVLPKIQQTAELAQAVANTSAEQRNGMHQISLAVQTLNEVTQRVANESNQLTKTVRNLVAGGESLQRAVSYFHL